MLTRMLLHMVPTALKIDFLTHESSRGYLLARMANTMETTAFNKCDLDGFK